MPQATHPSALDARVDSTYPPVKTVSVDDSAAWLAAGWKDLRRSPLLSLGYGFSFVLLGGLITLGLAEAGLGSLILPAAAGFLLIGPLAAVGLYEISRRHEAAERPTLASVCAALCRSGARLSGMGLVLLLIMFVWVESAILLFALFFNAAPPPLEGFVGSVLLSLDNAPFLVLGSAIGGVLAAVAFTVSVVSLPMLMDRNVSTATAIATSVAAVKANWQVMIGWAAMIALITGVGIATFFVGLAVALPLIGHASWHAYRGLVE